jgi:hypothetical protein
MSSSECPLVLSEIIRKMMKKYNAMERLLTREEAYRLDIQAELQNGQHHSNELEAMLAGNSKELARYSSRCHDLEAKLEVGQQRFNALKVHLAETNEQLISEQIISEQIISEQRLHTSTIDHFWKAREVEWQAAEVEWQAEAATQKEECSSLEVKLALSSSHCDELAQANQKWYSEYQKLKARHATSQDEVICAQNSAAVAAGAASFQCEELEKVVKAWKAWAHRKDMRHAEVVTRLASTEAQLAETIAVAAVASLAQHATVERLAGAEAESERLRNILRDVRATPPPPPPKSQPPPPPPRHTTPPPLEAGGKVLSIPFKDDARDTITSPHNLVEEFDQVDAEAHLVTASEHDAAEQLEQLEAAVIFSPKIVETIDTVITVKELVEQGLSTAAGPPVDLGPMAHVARSRLGSASETRQAAGLHLDLGFMIPQSGDTRQASVHSEPTKVVGAQAQRSTLGTHGSIPHAVMCGLGMVGTTANILWDPGIILSTTTSP